MLLVYNYSPNSSHLHLHLHLHLHPLGSHGSLQGLPFFYFTLYSHIQISGFCFPIPCRIAHQAPSILPSGPLIPVPPSGTITPRSPLDQEVQFFWRIIIWWRSLQTSTGKGSRSEWSMPGEPAQRVSSK